MTHDSEPPDLPTRLAAGVAALQAARWDDAIDALGPVYADPELASSEDLRDIRASVCSLYAQALLEAGRPHDADRPCRDAIRIVRALRDRAALDAVRSLQDRIVAAIAHDAERAQRLAEQARIAATPLDDLLAHAHDDAARAEVLVKKAQAHVDVGQAAEGAQLATRAVEAARLADHVTWEVFALLALARADASQAQQALHAAYRRAERAEEFNLVSATARTARELQVALPTEPGPHLPASKES